MSEELLQLYSFNWFNFAIALTWSGFPRLTMEPLLLGMSAFIGGSCLLDTDGFLPLGILFDTEFKCD